MKVRLIIHGIGELCITAGVVLLLFCAYQLVWTNVQAQRAQDDVADSITQAWAAPDPKPRSGDGQEAPVTPSDFGKGFAFLHVPRLGKDFTIPVVEGVRPSDLSRGVGHYPKSARPGEVGNFAVAGHRATNGEPFRSLDRMRAGDAVVVETKDKWFTYVVDRTRIVSPRATWVLQPVPGRRNAEPKEKLLTLTTCHPRWASTYRLIVFGHLAGEQAKSDGRPAALAREGR